MHYTLAMSETTVDTPTPPGFLLVISGPSGVGKSTITNAILDRLQAVLSVSMTTRPMADGDVDGEHYYFVDRETFQATIDRGDFLEHAEYAGNCYGTPREKVEEQLTAGRTVVLEIDVAGAKQVKTAMPDTFAVFILPPSRDALLDRLRSRKREDEATIQRRFGIAQREIEFAKASGIYDELVVNDDLEAAITQVQTLVLDEQRRRGG